MLYYSEKWNQLVVVDWKERVIFATDNENDYRFLHSSVTKKGLKESGWIKIGNL